MNRTTKYANLHLHSIYSDGIATPEELCQIVKEMGYRALALTDLGKEIAASSSNQ